MAAPPNTKVDKAEPSVPNASVGKQEDLHSSTEFSQDSFLSGVVQSWHPGRWTAVVGLGDDAKKSVPATWVAGVLASSFFGLRVGFHPEVGTSVQLLHDEPTDSYFIVGVYFDTTQGSSPRRDLLSEDTLPGRPGDAGKFFTGDQHAVRGDALAYMDRVGGEADFVNASGVGVSFLRHLVRMKSTDLASIECHMLDDLVRIISDNFQHVSSFGDFKIINDGGRPTVVWKGSSKEYETLGQDAPGGQELPDEDVDPYVEGARTRFAQYLGHLGNIFHMFVTDPAETLGGLAAGRFRAHVNEDGSFLMQSVGDIIFEKAVRIQVPVEQLTADDPSGDRLADMEYVEDPALQTWVAEDEDNLYYESYKLRDYARWMNNWFSLAQFHRSRRDYTVPTEDSSPPATHDNADLERPNGAYESQHAVYLTRYATIRIFRDGSILLMDGYNSTVHMAGGDVTASAARHLRLEAAGDISMTSGGDVTIKAYKNFDVAALTGGITARAQTWFRTICLQGKLLLESMEDTIVKGSSVTLLSRGDIVLSGRRLLNRISTYIITQAQAVCHTLNGVTHAMFTPTGNWFRNSLGTEGMVQCRQVAVKASVPVPTPSGQVASIVLPYPDGDVAGTIEDWEGTVNPENIDDVPGPEVAEQMQFEHASDFDTTSYPQSLTQAALSDDYVIRREDLTLPGSVSAIAPGETGQQKIYEADNPPMNEPSERNKQPNQSKALTDTAWVFRRYEDNE